MSADVLRQAAAKMREDHPWDQEHLDGPFYSALADLLDVWVDNDLIDSGFSLPEERECLTDLARAYLGESA